jgi:DUF2889 family protein
MPLPPPAPRELLHTRTIECAGYRRQDGLWDIEAHLKDVKSYVFKNDDRGELQPGDPLHEMVLRLTLDDDMVVKDVTAVTEAGPFLICGDIAPAFKKLVGTRVGPGWRGKVRELVGGVKGCTHLVELLGPMATVAFQTLWSRKAREMMGKPDAPSGRKPGWLDGCHALAADGPIVKQHHPEWYQPTRDSAGTT